ncbi:uncharacterized protein LOC132284790 [Cornus florida]|uniref:uncharacterized protein LOC132284790 n=1 Tax=Cornus florida TaxID=4283 RepID=UPI00289D3CB8|nr:uncharacterized protein LOC132284790 [Cornus florida]
MRGTAALLPAKNIFKQIHPTKRTWGIVATSTPKKQENNDVGEGHVTVDKADPIVAFSKPPPLPPVLGPIVVLSLFETWSSRDSSDD